MVNYQDKMARIKEHKTKMISIRTTPAIKLFIKDNNINQTEMFEKAINNIRNKKKREFRIDRLS